MTNGRTELHRSVSPAQCFTTKGPLFAEKPLDRQKTLLYSIFTIMITAFKDISRFTSLSSISTVVVLVVVLVTLTYRFTPM